MLRMFFTRLLPVLVVTGLLIVAAVSTLRQEHEVAALPSEKGPDISADDQAWLKTRLARGPVPLPKPNQPRVLLLWRQPIDAPKVRPVLPLVDHPEGINGVYGMDVTDTDPGAGALHYRELVMPQPAQGAWLVVIDSFGRQLEATPTLTPTSIENAFKMARGVPVSSSDAQDNFLNKPAPDFTTSTGSGQRFSLSALRGRKVLLTFYCGCSRCQSMSTALAKLQQEPGYRGVESYTVTHMSPARAKEFFGETGQQSIALHEASPGIASLYQSRICPRVWYIGADGKVKYDSSEGEDPLDVTAALRQALRTA